MTRQRDQKYRPLFLLAVAFIAGIFSRELSLPARYHGLPGYSHADSGSIKKPAGEDVPEKSLETPTDTHQSFQNGSQVTGGQSQEELQGSVEELLLQPVPNVHLQMIDLSDPHLKQSEAFAFNVQGDVGHSVIDGDSDGGNSVHELNRTDVEAEGQEEKDPEPESATADLNVEIPPVKAVPASTEDVKDYGDGEEYSGEFPNISSKDDVSADSDEGDDAGDNLNSQSQQQEQQMHDSTSKGTLSRALGAALVAGRRRLRRRKWMTPYVHPHPVNLKDEAACRGIVPEDFLTDAFTKPIQKLSDLKRQGRRILLVTPRFGLGNALRGYVSAFMYALLSGRQLVLLHSGQHAKVFDLLCEGFKCSYDAVHWNRELKDGAQVLSREVSKLKPFNILPHKLKTGGIIKSLKFSYPLAIVSVGSFFDFWRRRPTLKKCVYKALDCNSDWCVHSRAIFSLLASGPSKTLATTIRQAVQSRSFGNSTLTTQLSPVQKAIGVDVMFDVAIHIRTRTEAVEHSHSNQCEGDAKCKQEFLEAADARVAKYLSPRLWGCIRKIVLRQKAKKYGDNIDSAKFRIFLATDNELLRSAFVDRLATMGTVFFSTGKVVHTSKISGGMPTLAEWYLLAKADLVLEAESYISTFAYFSGLLGNSTLASLSIKSSKRCSLKVAHWAS